MATPHMPQPRMNDAFSAAELTALQQQRQADAVLQEASAFRRQVEAFSSQLTASQIRGDEAMLAMQVDLAMFRQQLAHLEHRLDRLEQAEQAVRASAPQHRPA